jgi:8-oxo-dGTP pyrophosphatase MutT (NUDIX family)
MPVPTHQSAIDPAELVKLEGRFGPLPYQEHRLAVDHPFLTGEHQLLVSDGRRAEICYVMHRGDPAAGLLLHIKRFYPPGAYRLPTGGIHQGEAVLATLVREIYEETGLAVGEEPGQVRIERCLGVVRYALAHQTQAQLFDFATYHFLVQMPAAGKLAPLDPDEQISGWQWRPPAELTAVAGLLEGVGQSHPLWADWGRYRALSHRFVAAQLTQ